MPPSFFCPATGDPYGSRNGVRTDPGHIRSSLDRRSQKTRSNQGFSSISFLRISGIAPAIPPQQTLTMRNEKQSSKETKPWRNTMKIQSKIKAGVPYIKT